MDEPKKLSVELAPDVAKALRFLADQPGVTVTEVTPAEQAEAMTWACRHGVPENRPCHECYEERSRPANR